MGSKERTSVILHVEDFEDIGDMKDAEAGKLLKAILAYATTGSLPDKLGIQAKVMFGYIRRHIDRDKEKYEETCRKRSEAGKQGGRPKKDSFANPEKAKKANGFSEKQKNPDTDTEPDTDTDTEPDTEPVAPQADAAGGVSDFGEDRAKRIRFLKTTLRLYQSGALTDKEDYKRYQDELNALEGV